MTKEEKNELIELSDLNREDNIKYISSEAQGIAITLNSDRYAPTFCKLERAYICGRRKSEKENSNLKERIHTLEVYLEGAVNYLILDGDVNNRIIGSVESILHITFNKSPNVPTVYQKLTKAEEILGNLFEIIKRPYQFTAPSKMIMINEAEQFLKEIEK